MSVRLTQTTYRYKYFKYLAMMKTLIDIIEGNSVILLFFSHFT